MSTETNKALVRRAIEEVWNQGNDFKRLVTALRSPFPNGHMTIEDMIAEGDQVVSVIHTPRVPWGVADLSSRHAPYQ